ARAGAAFLERWLAGAVGAVGRLGDLEELVEGQLAVLVGVELLERLHAVLEKLLPGDLTLLLGVDLVEPGRQRDRGIGVQRRRRRGRGGARSGSGRQRLGWPRRSLRRGRRRTIGRPTLGGWCLGGGGKCQGNCSDEESRAEKAIHRQQFQSLRG